MVDTHWLQPVLEPLRPALHRVAEERGGVLGRRVGRVAREAGFAAACRLDPRTRFLLDRPATPAAMREQQDERVRELVAYVERFVPGWRDALADAGVRAADVRGAEDLPRLPLLTRDRMRATPATWRSTDPRRRKVAVYETSGSSGEPMQIYIDWALRTLRKRARMRVLLDNGVRPGERLLHLWRRKGLQADDLISFLCGDLVRVDAMDVEVARDTGLDRERALELLARIDRAAPVVLRSYSNVLDVLCELYARHRDRFAIRPRLVWSCGEVLVDDVRARIADVFGARVLDHYGSTEADPIAHTLPGQSGMVVCEDLVVVELLDERDHPVEEGAGRVVLTDLHARAHPMLRYDTGDLAEWHPDSRPGARRLARLRGRHNDLVALPGGRLVLPDTWYVNLREGNTGWLERFQVEQRDVDDILVRLQVNDTFEEDALARVQRRVRASLGADVHVTWELADHLRADESGKLRHVISHVDAKAIVDGW